MNIIAWIWIGICITSFDSPKECKIDNQDQIQSSRSWDTQEDCLTDTRRVSRRMQPDAQGALLFFCVPIKQKGL